MNSNTYSEHYESKIFYSLLLRCLIPSILCFASGRLASQTTNNCVEIQSILVDACTPAGGVERENEMIRFLIGPNAVDINSFSVSYGFGQTWYGLQFPNATTAAKVAQLNASIQSCGQILEPTFNILPANSKVIFFTSPNVSSAANSFAGLSDTIYAIFQNENASVNAFFINYPGPLPPPDAQTTSISFGGVCSDAATYIRSNLINQSGVPGAGDGSTVNFAFDGTASYFNIGCSAPFTPLSASWTNPGQVCQSNGPIQLNNLITGTLGGTWTGTGVTGSTFNPAGLTGNVSVTYTTAATGSCQLQNTQTLAVIPSASASWTAPPLQLCSSAPPINLNSLVIGTPGGSFSGPGVNAGIFNADGLSGQIEITYSVGTSGCSANQSYSTEILSIPIPAVTGNTEFCEGEQTEPLLVSNAGGNTINWYSDSTLQAIEQTGNPFNPPAITANYYVVLENGTCVSQLTQVEITINPRPAPPSGDTVINYCSGEPLPLITLTGEGTFEWYTDAGLQFLVFSGSSFQLTDLLNTEYWITAGIGACNSAPVSVSIIEPQSISVSITASGPLVLCPGENVTLTSSAPFNNSWSTSETTTSITVSSEGTYSVSVAGVCNTATDEITVQLSDITVSVSTDINSGNVPFTFVASGTSNNSEECSWWLNELPWDHIIGEAFTLTEDGEYVVRFTCSNSDGCTVSDTIQLKVTDNTVLLEVPNVFSPNGDGVNDLFISEANGIESLTAAIFNRWGTEVFAWDGFNKGWDGYISGSPGNEGVYFYVISAVDIHGEPINLKGSVTLLK